MLSLLLAAVLAASYPQKIRTFYAKNDPDVPSQLSQRATRTKDWRVSTNGVVRVHGGNEEYFSGKRYLPDNHVMGLAPDNTGGVWVLTETGVSHIELRAMTLDAKAEIFEARIAARHDRHGFVSPSVLSVSGELATSHTRDDDNDGLWTSMYAAAECFRYSVTKSEEALAKATKAIDAVLFLEKVTGKPGFPARSYIQKGEPMPKDGHWHRTRDGSYYWKGDTSSDEIVGHMFLYGVAYDLLPDGPRKTRIIETTKRIMDHILEYGYKLVDITNRPTTWGRWDRKYFAGNKSDSPLNSLEILSFLKTAEHITHNPRYGLEYEKLLHDGYGSLTGRYTELRESINYSDEELAMLSFYNLIRYEHARSYYLPALAEWWDNERREDNPLWTYIYKLAHTSEPINMEKPTITLYQMPMNTITWTVVNSHRKDIVMAKDLDRFDRPQSITLLPRDELPINKWNANPFEIDGGDDGHSEDDGTAFLLPYWLGRYYNFISLI